MEPAPDWADGFVIPPNTIRIEAYEWWCGDDYCDCTEARIDVITPNPRVGLPWIERDTVWRGTFRSDGQTGGRTELNREAARLRKRHNDLFHRIEWPWDRSQRAS